MARLSIRKRIFDVVASLVALMLLSPILLVVAALIAVKLGRPVLFKQVRPGLHGAPFTILKFRTMTDARDGRGDLLPDEQRLGRFGRLLRASSLDELPELINVLTGRMSLVGPRPLLMEYLPLYSPEQATRHQVRPGLTGLAQIMGRNDVSWDERFHHDVWYVRNWTFLLDLKILVLTVRAVLNSRGIDEPGRVGKTKFSDLFAPRANVVDLPPTDGGTT